MYWLLMGARVGFDELPERGLSCGGAMAAEGGR